jgi:hypothetical protein
MRPHSFLRRRGIDLALIVVIGAMVLVVHDVGYLLGHPYWLDEAWVADSITAPLGHVPFLTSSTPLGWTALLRLVPGAQRGQHARLVPLAFCGLAAAAGYILGEELKLRRYLSGLLVGGAVLLSPAMLVRDDLKQYTAEAFASVATLALAARLENHWCRRRLLALGGFVVIAFLFASTELFVGAAVFGGLLVETAIGRNWRRASEVLVTGAATGILCGGLYLLTVGPNVNPALTRYWNAFYLPRAQGLSGLMRVLHLRANQLAPYMGFSHLPVIIPLAVAGIVTLAIAGRWALAVAAPATVAINIGAALTRNYPFGDQRTSTYWLVLIPVLIAIAVAYFAFWVSRWQTIAGIGVAAVALAVWVPSTERYVDAHPIFNEDVRDQVTYLTSHFHAGDVLILNEPASFGFAFYDRNLRPVYAHSAVLATGFQPEYPGTTWLVELHPGATTQVGSALATANAKIAAEPATARGRIWIVRSHQSAAEQQAWTRALSGWRVDAIPGSPEPLLLVRPSG